MSDFDTKKIAIYEPRLKISNEREWVIVKGGNTVTTQVYPASSASNKYFNFTTNPPGRKNVLDRHVILSAKVRLEFIGPGSGTPPGSSTDLMIQQGRDAFRSFPLSSIISTLTCKMNGFPVTIESDQIVHVLENFHNKIDSMNTYQSLYPNMADNYQNYSDADTSNRNPLACFGDNPAIVPRGAYDYTIVSNTNTGAVVEATIYEPLVLPPFLFDDSQAGGLTNLDTLSFNINLSTNLWRIWSRSESNTVPINVLNVTFSDPNLYLNWITPRDTQNIPDRVRYPYFQISRYVQEKPNGTAMPPNDTKDLKSQVIQLNSIPRKLYIFAKQSDSVIDTSILNSVQTTDTFLKINRINLNWDNNDGILSGSEDINLYEMSVANGLNYDWTSWKGLTVNCGTVVPQVTQKIGLKGSILCICPGVDFGLRNSQAEGVLDKIQFQVTLNVTNINQTKALEPDLYILAVYDGYLDIFNNSATAVIGAVTNSDILSTPVTYDISYHELQKIYGGDFFSKVRDTGSKLVKGLSKANDYLRDTKLVSNVLGAIPTPYTQSAASVAKTLGYGRGMGYGEGGVLRGGVLMGGCNDCDNNCDRNRGGAVARKAKLMRRLQNM